jgi:hypothetical protein
MIAKLPANVELDDLIQVGMIGLPDARSRFDAAQGVQFETFATQRNRGAMLDELRGNDWMSRATGTRPRPAVLAWRTLCAGGTPSGASWRLASSSTWPRRPG